LDQLNNADQCFSSSQEACDAQNVTMVDAAFRWLLFHSKLSTAFNDGVILGASSLQQFDVNLASCSSTEPLHASIVKAYDEAWEIARPDCPSYFRGTSNDFNSN
jgi:aflatoxin B1 aldehyde reductase